MDTDGHSDGYEEIGGRIPNKVEPEKRPLRPSALQLIGPKQGPSRTLWCEIQEVISSEILGKYNRYEIIFSYSLLRASMLGIVRNASTT